MILGNMGSLKEIIKHDLLLFLKSTSKREKTVNLHGIFAYSDTFSMVVSGRNNT